QAEDGIRHFHVTGVQTCALPIYFKSSSLNPSIISVPYLLSFVKRFYKFFTKVFYIFFTITSMLHFLGVAIATPLINYCRCILFRSEEHTSELQSRENLVCRLLLE